MSRIRGKNTTPERYIARLLDAAGLVYTQHEASLPGRPDFVFAERRVAVFVEGDFWHGWRFPVWQHRLSDRWREKILQTRKRDQRCHRKLRRDGWRVIRIWEHQVESDVVACIGRIARLLGRTKINWKVVEQAYAELPPLKRRNRLPRP